MEWISRGILHIESYFLLSKYSTFIIQWSLMLLIVLFISKIIFKDLHWDKISLYIGVAVRLILLVGLSIEMFHQVKVTELSSVYYDRDQSVRQFLYFLCYGYVVVVGLFYIVTIEQRVNKGLFYTFDIAVLSLPLLQFLTSFFFYLSIENQTAGFFDLLFWGIIVSFVVTLLWLFFKNFWNPNMSHLLWFYLLVFMPILPILTVSRGGIRLNQAMELTSFSIFLLLLMTYHLFILKDSSFFQKSKRVFRVVTVILFTLVINPFYNVGDYALATTEAEVKLRYFEVMELVTLNESKSLASLLTGEEDFFLRHRPHEDFHNVYRLSSSDYTIDIDGISGMVINLNRLKAAEGRLLEMEEYVERSLKVLVSLGRELLSENKIEINTNTIENRVIVSISRKFSDGSTNDVAYAETSFTWEQESLMGFHETPTVYPVESLRNMSVSEEDIDAKLKDWYSLVGKDRAPFTIENIQYGYSNRRIEIIISTYDNDRLIIDGTTGELIDFYTELDHEDDLPLLEERILLENNINQKEWDRRRSDSSWVWTEIEPGNKIPYQYSFGYYKGSTSFGYSKSIDYYNLPKSETNLATSLKAVKIVEDQLSIIPYATRTRFTHVIDENETIRKAWLVVIQPYGSSQHMLYLVDLESLKVEPLYE